MRKAVRLSVMVVTVLFGSAPVLAIPPTIEFCDVGGPTTITGVCSFDVFAEPTGNKERLATFFNQSGDITFQILTGMNKWRFTNLETGTSIDVNASGPGRFFVQPGSDVVRAETGGVSFCIVPDGTGGLPTFALTRGRLVIELVKPARSESSPTLP